MNYLFKRLFFFLIVLSGCILVSCHDDDNDDTGKASIVGAWVSETLPFYEEENVPSTTTDCVCYFWFKENGTFVELDVITNHQRNHTYTELSENGKWSVNGDYITWSTNFDIHEDPESSNTETFRFRISGNLLTIFYPKNGEEKNAKFQRTTIEKIQEVVSAAKNK